MKLYIYDHCPFCTRARMAFALKKVPVRLSIIMEGDADTPIRLIGKKVVPILEKEDGTRMAESLDIVHYVDHLGTPVFDNAVDPQIDAWIKAAWPVALRLFIPRFTEGDFPELATAAARDAYRQRETQAFGDLAALIAETPALLAELTPKLTALAPLVQARQQTDLSDIVLWPLLRCLSIVKALPFPPAVRGYAERLATETAIPLLFNQAR